MTTITIIGLVLWVVWVLLLLFGNVTVDAGSMKINSLTRATVVVIALPFVGVLFTIFGLIGLVILSPVLHFFGWSWFIIPNF